MSIPDRFYRIAKHKLGEMKEWFDKVDEEEDAEAELQRRRASARTDARRELSDTLAAPGTSGNGTVGMPRPAASGTTPSSVPLNPPRPSQDSQRNARSTPSYSNPSTGSSTNYTSSNNSSSNASSGSNGNMSNTTAPDPLDYHYKLLGLEPGVEFSAVQSAYNKLAARCDPARFPAGSSEEQQARQIRERLDVSFKQLREVLDSTSTRFGLLEF